MMDVYVVIQEESGTTDAVIAVTSDNAKAHEIIRMIRQTQPNGKFRVSGFIVNMSPNGVTV